MPFYIRKGIKVGPLRINLSKSGIGLSGGVTGARVGIRPDGGTYVHMGRGGLYYRKSLGKVESSGSSGHQRDRVPLGTDDYAAAHGVAASELVDASSTELLRRINDAAKDRVFIALTLLACVVALGAVLKSIWWTVGLGIVAWYVYGVIKRSYKASVSYQLDEDATTAFAGLQHTVEKLSQARVTWRVLSDEVHGDWKRNAGARSSVTRSRAVVGEVKPPHVTVNVRIYGIKSRRFGLYFFPDALYFLDDGRYACVTYTDLELHSSWSDFSESGSVPADANVVRMTWQYVRRDGGPDRRFNNNRQLPVARYGFLRFTSPAGLNAQFLVSSEDVSSHFARLLADCLTHSSEEAVVSNGGLQRPQDLHPATDLGQQAAKTSAKVESVVAALRVLGLERDATREQVSVAYRSAIQNYHPDKVSHLGKNFQLLAERRTREAVYAYKAIREYLDQVPRRQ